MVKLNRIITVKVGEKQVAFTGREKFVVEDAAFKKQLLALGTFAEQDDGSLRYSGTMTVQDKDGVHHDVDAEGYAAVARADLSEAAKKVFI